MFLDGSNHEQLFDYATKELKNLSIRAHPETMHLIILVENLVHLNEKLDLKRNINLVFENKEV